MELKEFNIMLDIKKYKKIEDIEIVQGDYESNVLNISIVEDYEPYNLAGLNVEIAFAKPDGTTVLQDEENGVIIEDPAEGKIRCILNTNTIAASGKVFAEVRILQDLWLLTTARFDFFVRRAIVNDETIESTNEFPILNRKIQEVNDLVEEIQSKPTIKGDPGDSAYQIWLKEGNEGTVEDYLASLKGEPGPKGEQGKIGPIGPDGKSIEYIWNGTELGIRQEGQIEYQYVDLKGPRGEKGDKGDPGTSLKILGNYDTLQELQATYPDGSSLDGGFMVGINYYYWGLEGWTNAGPLQGPKGEQGFQGEQGLPGEDGKSLEFIWNGTELGVRIEGQTEYAYVNLKGEKGEPGTDGSDAEVTKENVKTALGYTPASEDELNALAGEGRTTETVKQNADDIVIVQQDLVAHKAENVQQVGGVHGLEIEQGLWTPKLIGAEVEGEHDYATQVGTYYKIGKFVICMFQIALTSKDSNMSGVVRISGLPFTIDEQDYGASFSRGSGIIFNANDTQITGYGAGVFVQLNVLPSGGFVYANAVQNNASIRGSVSYVTM